MLAGERAAFMVGLWWGGPLISIYLIENRFRLRLNSARHLAILGQFESVLASPFAGSIARADFAEHVLHFPPSAHFPVQTSAATFRVFLGKVPQSSTGEKTALRSEEHTSEL